MSEAINAAKFDPEALRAMTETELRDMTVPRAETVEDLAAIVRVLTEREHTYGTCVYAMSIAAEVAFRLVASKLGVTGFQASCADMQFLSRTRGYKHGFKIVNYADILYPQYAPHLSGKLTISAECWKAIREEARKLFDYRYQGRPSGVDSVRAWWKGLADGVVPDYLTVEEDDA